MKLTVIRHLPTEWNKRGLLQGKRDISLVELTREDYKQITVNKEKLKVLAPFDIVLTSPLKRAIKTAHLHGFSQIEIEPLANELDFGQYEGLPKQQLICDHEKFWYENPVALKLGEKLTDFQKRILDFLEKYSCYSNVLLFGHGSWIRALASLKDNGTIKNMNHIVVNNNALLCFSFSNEEINNLHEKRRLLN